MDSACRTLSGFTPLKECEKWNLVPGGKYYVTRNRSSIIAFTLPEGDFDSFRMVASHSDSPTFKIKENAEISVRDHYIQLDVERYGGMIFSTWFDRPLSIAGPGHPSGRSGAAHPSGGSGPPGGDDSQRSHSHEPGSQFRL